MRALPLLLLAGCGDLDFDGVVAGDCDPNDPLIYPGAPDAPQDGIDADCDGTDPGYPFVGIWELTAMSAEYFSQSALVDDSESGWLRIDGDLGTEMNLAATIDGEILGFTLPVEFVLRGDGSAIPDSTAVSLNVKGDLAGEKTNGEWTCEAFGPELDCLGTLKALETNFLVEAAFLAQE